MNRERRSLLVALLGFGLLAGQLGFAAAQSANRQDDVNDASPQAVETKSL